MKLFHLHPTFRHRRAPVTSLGLLIVACLTPSVIRTGWAADAAAQPAQPAQASGPAASRAEPADSPRAAEAVKTDSGRKTAAPALHPKIEEIVRLIEAGVSPEVVHRYIQSSNVAYPLAAPDLVILKQRGVPDTLTLELLSRSAKAHAQAAAHDTVAAPAIVRTLATDGKIDPESYEFFWYHHAYPRILENSSQRLSPYVPARSGRHGSPNHWRTSGFHKHALAPARRSAISSRGR